MDSSDTFSRGKALDEDALKDEINYEDSRTKNGL